MSQEDSELVQVNKNYEKCMDLETTSDKEVEIEMEDNDDLKSNCNKDEQDLNIKDIHVLKQIKQENRRYILSKIQFIKKSREKQRKFRAKKRKCEKNVTHAELGKEDIEDNHSNQLVPVIKPYETTSDKEVENEMEDNDDANCNINKDDLELNIEDLPVLKQMQQEKLGHCLEKKYNLSQKSKEKRRKFRTKERKGGKKVKRVKLFKKLLLVETVRPLTDTNYFIWETLFFHFLKMNKKYTTFLEPSKTWKCLNDDPNRGQSNEDIKNLDDMITTLASYSPNILDHVIINECTSISNFFGIINDFFAKAQNEKTIEVGAPHTRSTMFEYNKLKNSFRNNGSMSYIDFYLDLRGTKYEIIDMKINGSTYDANEKMTSDVENEIVIDWLEGIDLRLPDFIEQKYSIQLETFSLHDLQDEISNSLDSHLLEIEENGKSLLQVQFDADYEEESDSNDGNENNENELFDEYTYMDDNYVESQQEGIVYNCYIDKCNFETNSTASLKSHINFQHREKYLEKHKRSKPRSTLEMKNNVESVDPTKLPFNSESKIKKYYSYDCDQCSYKAKQKRNLKNHVETIHEHEAIFYNCDQCDYKTKRKDKLKMHVQVEHDGIRYECEQCSYKAKKKEALKSHILADHEGIRFNCNQCDYTAKRKEKLKRHLGISHMGIIYNCDQCSYQAKNKVNLKNHVRSKHEGIVYNCDECKFETKSTHSLKSHIDFQHKGVCYNCDICDYKSKSKKCLNLHVESKHDGVIYPCEQCDYTTTHKMYMKSHVLTKHNAVISQCKLCTYSYNANQKQNLKRHMLAYHDDVFLKCEQCEYQTKFKDTLKDHIKFRHEGVSFKCDLCDYKVASSKGGKYLEKHKKSKHGSIQDMKMKIEIEENNASSNTNELDSIYFVKTELDSESVIKREIV